MIKSERHLFDLADGDAYFNVAGMSPLLKKVHEAGAEGLSRKCHPWKISCESFFAESDRARELFAKLINSEALDIALIPAASYGVATAVKNINVKIGGEVLIQAEEFPAMYYPLERVCREKGAKLVTIPRPANGDWTTATLALINERTCLVAAVPAHWTDGTTLDCVAVGKKCREVGAALVIDGCQSLGAVPFDVKAVQPDFLIAPTYKWMMGPYGYGFLYVAKKYHNGTALEETWLARQGSEIFSNLVNYRSEYRPGATRFDMGERSSHILLPMAVAALEQLHAWKPTVISERISEIVNEISEGAEKKGYVAVPKEHRSTHMVGIRHPNGIPTGLAQRLEQDKIYVSFRGSSIRVAPHLHVSQTDIDRFLSHL
jgi:selenocysteine lyase/cysteine desulfurase